MGENENNKLDAFLKRNAPRPPQAPLGEKARIWRAIEESKQAHSWREWLSLPELRVAFPAFALCMLVLVVLHARKLQHDAEVDRVLAAALHYQLDDGSEDSPF